MFPPGARVQSMGPHFQDAMPDTTRAVDGTTDVEALAMGFPAVLGPFLRSYLVGRRTTYKWDSFMSDPFAADVGVGQGSAMSPVLSALYLTLIMRRFRASDVGRKVDLMSYVDDGTIIAQSRRVEDNLPLLKEAYGWLFRAFESLGLVLEHDKSEVFHFSRARSFVGPAIDLGYAPYTGATSLRPKPVWRYLGFFFDRKLQFKEHARFYTTRAFHRFLTSYHDVHSHLAQPAPSKKSTQLLSTRLGSPRSVQNQSLTNSYVNQPTSFEWGTPRIGQIGGGASPSCRPQPLCGYPKP
jgi:hypothetical protein